MQFDWLIPLSLGIAAVAAAIVVINKATKWVTSIIKKLNEFLEDWRGEDARPGYSRKLGMPERLEKIEQRLHRVEGQLVPNGGDSLRDKVDQIVDKIGTDPDKNV